MKYSPRESSASGMCLKLTFKLFLCFSILGGEGRRFCRKGGQEALMDGGELKGVFRREHPKTCPCSRGKWSGT